MVLKHRAELVESMYAGAASQNANPLLLHARLNKA
jgi:hypothetical protein